MKTLIRSAAGLAMFSLMVVADAGPPMVNPDPMTLDPETTAMILKEKSKRNTSGEIGGGIPGSKSSKDCGTVNINSNDKKSNSGIKDMFGKPSTTIVTGPVINMANCK